MNSNIVKERRIKDHPILGPLPNVPGVIITVNSKKIIGRRGEPILAALIASGFDSTRTTEKLTAPRGLFCGIGVCTDCLVTVDGMPNVRSCVTPVEEGLVIQTQSGRGKWVHEAKE
ncbi:(2Fe-2S)-binding protein [Candidatus Bipolaricaulota bacterium]|nr:(2Fe-2S)-binding protein [Candidatus Bipolaricaulota bacterium]